MVGDIKFGFAILKYTGRVTLKVVIKEITLKVPVFSWSVFNLGSNLYQVKEFKDEELNISH
jgi:hypothetical protein